MFSITTRYTSHFMILNIPKIIRWNLFQFAFDRFAQPLSPTLFSASSQHQYTTQARRCFSSRPSTAIGIPSPRFCCSLHHQDCTKEEFLESAPLCLCEVVAALVCDLVVSFVNGLIPKNTDFSSLHCVFESHSQPF